MVIDARRTFRCAHTYVVLTLAGLPVFVCATCDYRTELLALRKSGAACGPGTVVDIGRIGSHRDSQTAHATGGV